jgi:hypothetical protein
MERSDANNAVLMHEANILEAFWNESRGSYDID